MGTSPGALSQTLKESYALVYAPRRTRQRYPENCVFPVESAEAALEGFDAEGKMFPAKVCGPFQSSEGLRLYYLLMWLD